MSNRLQPISTAFYEDIEATVKFFDPAKGYGFVVVSDGSPDAFLPAAVVTQAGYRSFHPGTVIFCALAPGAKGREVTAIHYVDDSMVGSAPARVRSPVLGTKPQQTGAPKGKARRSV